MASRGAKWTIVIVVIVLILGGLYAAAFFVASGNFGDFGIAASDPEDLFYDTHEEQIVESGDGDSAIAMINVVGEIFSDPDGAAEGASDANLTIQLEHAKADDSVAGVILNLETPGGGVVASGEIYKEVVDLERTKPVIALMGDVSASGGYYIAMGATEVIAHPSTWTGSIGVIAILPNVSKAADKLGVEVTVVKSGAMKDAGSPFRALTPEEQQLFQSLVNDAYEEFVGVVAKGRKMSPEEVRPLADGRVYTGRQAKNLRLVDDIGNLESAFARAKKLSDAPDASLVRYTPALGFDDLLGASAKRLGKRDPLEEAGLKRRPGAAYLWLP